MKSIKPEYSLLTTSHDHKYGVNICSPLNVFKEEEKSYALITLSYANTYQQIHTLVTKSGRLDYLKAPLSYIKRFH